MRDTDLEDDDIARELNIEDVEPKASKPIDSTPEEFYNRDDSFYIRLQYFEENEHFKFEVKNPIMNKYEKNEDVPQYLWSLCAFIRGIVEVAMSNPQMLTHLGVKAINADASREVLEEQVDTEGLTEGQIALLHSSAKGNA